MCEKFFVRRKPVAVFYGLQDRRQKRRVGGGVLVMGGVSRKRWRVEEAKDQISKFKSAAPCCTYSSVRIQNFRPSPPPPKKNSRFQISCICPPPPSQTHHLQGNKGGKQGVNRAIISQEPKGTNKAKFNTILCLAPVITDECTSRDFVGNSKYYILKSLLASSF